MTITFRLDEKRRAALRKYAAAHGKSESQLLRDLIDRELAVKPIGERVRHLMGSLSIDPAKIDADPWRKHIRRQNWRK